MNTKSLIAAVVVLVILVIVYVSTTGDREDSQSDQATSSFESFKSLDEKAVDRITVERDDVKVELVRTEAGDNPKWELKSSFGYPADPERIDRLYEELEKIEDGEKVGSKAASHSRFEVDAESGAKISFFVGAEQKAAITLGKRANSRTLDSYSFVRFGDDAEVYKVDGEARSYIGAGGDKLEKDYTLLKELYEIPESNKVISAQLTYPDKTIMINRVDREKVIEEPKDPNKEETTEEGKIAVEEPSKEKKTEKVEEFHVTSGAETFKVEKDKEWDAKSYLNNHKSLRVKEAVEPKSFAEYGLDKPQLKVTLTSVSSGGDILATKVLFGNAIKDDKGEDTGYYVALEGQTPARIYSIEKYTITSWKKEVADFKPKPPEPEKKEDNPAIIPDGGKEGANTSSDAHEGHSHEGQVTASHILIPYKGADSAAADVTRTKEEAKKEAERILAEVKKEGSDFAKFAKDHSSCSSASDGGNLGSFSYGQMVKPFSEAAFEIKPGDISEIVETGFGFHIIKRTK